MPRRSCAAPRYGPWRGSTAGGSPRSRRHTGRTNPIRRWRTNGRPCYNVDMNAKLKDIIERVDSWPEEAQEEAAQLLLALEQEYAEPYELSDEDRRAIDRSLEDMK